MSIPRWSSTILLLSLSAAAFAFPKAIGEKSPTVVLSGTILLWSATRDGLIVVVDSRTAQVVGGRLVPTGDEGCKVIAPSKDTLFFYSGVTEYRLGGIANDLLFSANNLAK